MNIFYSYVLSKQILLFDFNLFFFFSCYYLPCTNSFFYLFYGESKLKQMLRLFLSLSLLIKARNIFYMLSFEKFILQCKQSKITLTSENASNEAMHILKRS